VSRGAAFLYTLLPWNFITEFHEGVVVQKDGTLQRTFAYRAPDADSSSSYEMNDLCLRVNDFAKRLGTGWAFFVEAQRFCTLEYPAHDGKRAAFGALSAYLIDREREEAFSSSGKHFESSYYLTFAWRPPVESVKKLTSLFIQSADGAPSKNMKENVAYFASETDAAVGLLSSSMLIAPLTNEQTVAYLHSAVSFNRHPIRFPHTQLFLDRILPDSELLTSLTMRLGEFYMPIIGVNDFPEETYPAIFESLNRARLEYRWVSRYVCLDKEEAKKEAQKKEKAHRGSRKSFMQTFAEATSGPEGAGSASLNHGASVKEEDSIQAGVEIETDQAALGYFSSNVMVWDASLESAKKKAETVRNIVNSMGFTCKEERFNALEAWKSMMPGQAYANYRSLPIMSYTLSHVIPLSSVWSGIRVNEHAGRVSGISLPHVTSSTREGTPFYLNLNPGGDVGHTGVFGPTGAGKSTLLNLLEAQFFKYPNSQVIVFDKGRSCRQICLASGGLFYEPAAENSSISFQPLRDLETDRDIIDAMDFIESLFLVNNYKVTPPMRKAVKDCLDLLREKDPDDRTITSFLHYVNYVDSETKRPVFNERLGDYLWAGGKYGKIFDSRTRGISLDARFLALEMEALMNQGDGCVVPAMVYLFNLVEKKFDGRLTLLVLDEAWLFLKNETFREKITEWLKVLRKKNVFVVFATQDVADIEKSPLKTTVIQQCLTKIYLADPSAFSEGILPVYRAFGLTDAEIGLIASSVMKRDYFYSSPLGRRLFQLDLGPLALSLIGTPDHKLLDELSAKNGPGVPLCRDILERKRVDYLRYMENDAPADEPPETGSKRAAPVSLPPQAPPKAAPFSSEMRIPSSLILDAAAALTEDRSKKGKGRAADLLAVRLGVSPSTVYNARKILRYGDGELIERVRNGEITIRKAAKKLVVTDAG